LKKPVVDHLWSKIGETDSIGLSAVVTKLAEVAELSGVIAGKEGTEVLNNVMDNGLIAIALARCKKFHEGGSSLTRDDFYINYNYATISMRKSEQIIDTELEYLGL
jgi:hypothetical protein